MGRINRGWVLASILASLLPSMAGCEDGRQPSDPEPYDGGEPDAEAADAPPAPDPPVDAEAMAPAPGVDGAAPEAEPGTLIRFRAGPRAGDLEEVEVTVERDGDGLVGLQFDVHDPSGRLVLRSQRATPAGVALGSDAAAAGKMVSVTALPGGATRVIVFALAVEPIADGDGDGVKRVATLSFDVVLGSAAGAAPLTLSGLVITDALGRRNGGRDGLSATVVQEPPQL